MLDKNERVSRIAERVVFHKRKRASMSIRINSLICLLLTAAVIGEVAGTRTLGAVIVPKGYCSVILINGTDPGILIAVVAFFIGALASGIIHKLREAKEIRR